MNLKNIMLTEENQTQVNTVWFHLWISGKAKLISQERSKSIYGFCEGTNWQFAVYNYTTIKHLGKEEEGLDFTLKESC
jgi:hypothetical protein